MSAGRAAVVAIATAVLLCPLPGTAQTPERAASPAASEHEDDDLFADEDLFEEDDLFGDETSQDDFAPVEEESSQSTEASEPSTERSAQDRPPAAEPIELEPFRDDDAPTEGIEEILVEGQAGSSIDVEAPLSVTSFGADDLEALGVQDISDLAAYTPNTEIRTTGATTPTFFIRGVGLNDFTANGEGAIAIYQDDVVLSLPAIQLGQLFDTASVDVLRGPQGSGAARNASGGAIHISSKRPTGDFSGFVRAEYGRFNLVDVEGAVELPLLADMLSTRIAFRVEQRDPFVKNACRTNVPIGLERVTDPTNNVQPALCGENTRVRFRNPNPPPGAFNVSTIPTGLPDKVNDTSRWAARALLRFQPPASDADITLNIHGARIDQRFRVGQSIGTDGAFRTVDGEAIGGFFGGNARGYRSPEVENLQLKIEDNLGINNFPIGDPARAPIRETAKRKLSRRLAKRLDDNPYSGDYNNPGRERMTSYGSSLAIDWQSNDVHVKNVVAFEAYDRFRDQDADYSSVTQFEAVVRDRAWQVSEDLRLSGELDRYPLSWEVGGLFLIHDFDNDRRDAGGLGVSDVRVIYNQKAIGGNAFATGTFDFLDDFTLKGGVRYNIERKSFDQQLFRSSLVPQLPGRPCIPPNNTGDCDSNRLEHAPTGSVSLTYHAAEELSFYWSYTRGWKSTQFSGGGTTSIKGIAKPETVDAFEVGTSGSWFDGRLTARGSMFHYTYANYHVFITRSDVTAGPVREVVNADDALLYGAEITAMLEPIDGFVIDVNGGWIESEFLDFSLEAFRELIMLPAPPVATRIEQVYTGNRLPNTPRFTFSGSMKYAIDFGRFGIVTPRWDFTWTEDVFFDQTEGRGNPNADNQIFLPKFAIGQEDYWLHNLRLTYTTAAGGIEISGWVRNLENKIYKAIAFDATAAGFVGNLPGDPRTYGVTVELNW